MGGTVFISPVAGWLASAPDGSTAFTGSSNGEMLRRTAPGVWEPTGLFGHVFTTGTSVLVIADADQTVTEVWPETAEADG